MANKEIHELITAEELTASDVIAEQRENSGTWLSRKLTFNALGLFLLNQLDYATELHTTSKKIIGAINELKDGVSAVTIGTTAPSDSLGDNRNLYIQYDGTDYSVVAMYVKIEDSWRPIELGGGGGSYVELTQAEYDALEQAGELEEDTIYFITDVNGDGSQFQPVIYSTTEREIGVWIDGKPVYEKTQYISALPSSIGDWVNYPHGISNFDRLISVSATAYNSTVPQQLNIPHVSATTGASPTAPQISISVSETNIAFIVGQDRSSWEAYVTIQYTKSTDAPGSGTWTPQGVPAVHYSSDEKIVGTWIDGSTIYECSHVFETEINVGRTWVDTSWVVPNVDKILGVEAMTTAGTYWTLSAAKNSNNEIRLLSFRTDENCNTKYLTIRYTKAST